MCPCGWCLSLFPVCCWAAMHFMPSRLWKAGVLFYWAPDGVHHAWRSGAICQPLSPRQGRIRLFWHGLTDRFRRPPRSTGLLALCLLRRRASWRNSLAAWDMACPWLLINRPTRRPVLLGAPRCARPMWRICGNFAFGERQLAAHQTETSCETNGIHRRARYRIRIARHSPVQG